MNATLSTVGRAPVAVIGRPALSLAGYTPRGRS